MIQISDHSRAGPRPLRRAFLIPPDLLVVADLQEVSIQQREERKEQLRKKKTGT